MLGTVFVFVEFRVYVEFRKENTGLAGLDSLLSRLQVVCHSMHEHGAVVSLGIKRLDRLSTQVRQLRTATIQKGLFFEHFKF